MITLSPRTKISKILGTKMADDNNLIDVPPPAGASPPSTPSPSTTLPLSGFISGDTIQVHGDTGNLQFSLQFNIRQKQTSDNHFHVPDLNTPENQTSLNSSASSSYITPCTSHEIEDQGVNIDTVCHGSVWTPVNEDGPDGKTGTVMTRLRSGVLSRITHRPQRSRASQGRVRFRKGRKGKKRNGETRDVLEKILRRRSHPVRPCNSYSLFVMASWGTVKRSSFEATSKRLGEMWCKLSHDEKKVYEDLALKDTARYKRQCILLKDHVHQGTNNSAELANLGQGIIDQR